MTRVMGVSVVLLFVLGSFGLTGCSPNKLGTQPIVTTSGSTDEDARVLPSINGLTPPLVEPPDSIKVRAQIILQRIASGRVAPMQSIAGIPSSRILSNTYSWLGVPYLPAGNSRSGVDCSHLVYQVFRSSGFRDYPYLTTASMKSYRYFTPVGWNDDGGDIVLFRNLGHTGIYIGCGWFIDANSAYGRVMFDSIFSPYWKSMGPYAVRYTPPACYQ